MPRRISPLVLSAVPTREQIDAVAAVLDGPATCLLPVPDGNEGARVVAAARPGDLLPDRLADAVLAVATTGSTGAPKVVLHSRETLLASIESTAERLGGHGQWLLCLGISHIAGAQVVLRSAVAGIAPVVCAAGGDNFPENFAAAAGRLEAARRYVSLVPTQLQRLLDSDAASSLRALTVLLGGAAADPALLARASASGVRVVTSYGMSETAGGCVYDGMPLDGVRVDVADAGVVRLSGPVVALGYRDAVDPDPFAVDAAGTRSFTTSDLGELDRGRLRILGRADDVINTGGKKVSPVRVENALRSLPGLADAIVVGVDDPEWGQRIVAIVTSTRPAIDLDLADVRSELRGILAPFELPRQMLVVDQLPYAGIGKPDRAAARRIAAG